MLNKKIFGIIFVLLLILMNIPFAIGNEQLSPFENFPPFAEANGPYYGNVGENISFDSSGTYDPEGGPLDYLWNFGDGNTSTQANPDYAYSEYGEYAVVLTVWDDWNQDDSDNTAAYVNAFPVAVTGGPYYCNAGEPITFNGSGSYDPDGYIVNWTWYFDDGTYGYGETTNHSFQWGGEYIVNLTVTDNLGGTGYDLTIAGVNSPPDAPYINGPKTGHPGKHYEYVFNSIDYDNDDIRYIIDWGDETFNETDYYPSGRDVTISHTWTEKGEYTITAYAEDVLGATSRTSIFQVTIPRNKAISNPVLNFLQSHPNLFPLLQKLIQQLGL